MRMRIRNLIETTTVAGLALQLFACGGGSSSNPVAPSPTNFVLSSVTVAMNGQLVSDGMSVHRSTTAGGSTRFEAHLMDGAHAAVGDQANMRYGRPMGMMNQSGTLGLYDDGTHGDRVPNDGVYCYEDSDGSFGIHMMDAAMGQYHFEFWGTDPRGHDSNHLSLAITMTP